MTKRHAPSFLFSLIVHVVAIAIFFYTYQYITYLTKKKREQKRVCVKLVCINEAKKVTLKPTPLIEQKIKKTLPKEVIKKRIIKKIVPKKKKIKKKKIKKKIVKKKIVKKIKIKKRPKKLTPAPIVQEDVVEFIVPKDVVYKVKEKEIFIKEEAPKVKQSVIETVAKPPHEEKPKLTQEDITKINQEKYINNNLQNISQLLSDNLYYPRRARKRGIVGEVVVKFHLSQSAEVSDISIISSKSDILSRAARKTIENLSGEFPKPTEELILQIPIKYSLTQR